MKPHCRQRIVFDFWCGHCQFCSRDSCLLQQNLRSKELALVPWNVIGFKVRVFAVIGKTCTNRASTYVSHFRQSLF